MPPLPPPPPPPPPPELPPQPNAKLIVAERRLAYARRRILTRDGKSQKTNARAASRPLSVHQIFHGPNLGHPKGTVCVVEVDDEGAGTVHVSVPVTLLVPDI